MNTNNFDPHDLAREELRHLYQGNLHAFVITSLSGFLLAVVLAWKLHIEAALAWFGWLQLCHGWQWMLGRAYRAGGPRTTIVNVNHHILAAAFAGLGWGALVLALPSMDRVGLDVLVVALLVLVNIVTARLAIYLPVLLVFSAGIYIPLLVMGLFLEPEARAVVVIVTIIAATLQWLAGRELRRVLVETLHKQLSFERASWEDKLTGLGNRRHFEERLEASWQQAIRLKVPLSLIMLDVDHFKKYNDTYGHTAGDECLRQVATALGGCVKRANDTVARFGGEEFVAVLFHTNVNDARIIAERLGRAVMDLRLPHEQSSHEIVTVSVGGATQIPQIGTNSKELLDLADEALYKAKSAGRNRVEWAEFHTL